MTGVIPVAGRLDRSSAISDAAPRRNPYGEELRQLFESQDPDGLRRKPKIAHHSKAESYWKIDGHYTHKLWPYSGIEVAKISVPSMHQELKDITSAARTLGAVPAKGLADIHLRRLEDGTYEWREWRPHWHRTAIDSSDGVACGNCPP